MAVAIFLPVIFFSGTNLRGQQNDSIPPVRKTISRDSARAASAPLRLNDSTGRTAGHKELSRPKKALLYALVLPGAGQVYNKKFWKLPILYAGAGACAYFWITNHVGYKEFKSVYNVNYDSVKANSSYVVYEDQMTYGSLEVYTSLAQLANDRDTYRRYRDFSIAASVALYAISVLDAYVDAHLKDFSVSPDLSFSVKPLFYNYNNATFAPGLSLSLKLKNNRTRYNELYKNNF